MNLPFYYTTSINTGLSKEEVKGVLYKHIITDKGKTWKDKRVTVMNKNQFESTGKNYLYKGWIKESGFKLIRILERYAIGGKPANSFNPFCLGKFYVENNNCIIKLKIRSAIPVLVFMFIWTSGVIFGTVGIIMSEFRDGRITGVLITPLALSPFYLGFWFLNKFGFKKEVKRTLSFLNSIGLKTNVS